MKNRLQKLMSSPGFLVRRILLMLFITVGIVLTVSLVYVFGTPFDWRRHDSRLAIIASTFDGFSLPTGTKQVGVVSAQLSRLGNGNHCDYIVSKLIDTQMSEQELSNYYAKQRATLVGLIGAQGEVLEGITQSDTATILSVRQPWKETETYGSYISNAEKAIRLAAFQASQKQALADRHKVTTQVVTDTVFEIALINYGNRANDPRCR